MRFRGRSGESGHKIRYTLLGLFLVTLALIFVPDLGAGHAQEVRNNRQSPTDQSTLGTEDNPFDSPDQILTWTVLRHQGYNTNFQCWILQLDRKEGPQQETTGQFCAKDKAEYDSVKDGDTYQTKGSWLDNLTSPATQPRSDST